MSERRIERYPLPTEADPSLTETPWQGNFARDMKLAFWLLLAFLALAALWFVAYVGKMQP